MLGTTSTLQMKKLSLSVSDLPGFVYIMRYTLVTTTQHFHFSTNLKFREMHEIFLYTCLKVGANRRHAAPFTFQGP